ncbi:hypothetical protein LA080_012664 [Diaporthe eres]|nr:hypothetical protein LA080_012664 [Diaporthe eres]
MHHFEPLARMNCLGSKVRKRFEIPTSQVCYTACNFDKTAAALQSPHVARHVESRIFAALRRRELHFTSEGWAVLPVLAIPAPKFQAPELWDNTEPCLHAAFAIWAVKQERKLWTQERAP